MDAQETAFVAVRYLVDMPAIGFRPWMCQASAYLHISADIRQPLHEECQKTVTTQNTCASPCMLSYVLIQTSMRAVEKKNALPTRNLSSVASTLLPKPVC